MNRSAVRRALALVVDLDETARRARPRRSRLDALFDELCAAYASVDEVDRRVIRTAYVRMQNWHDWDFWFYRKHYAVRFSDRGDPTDLRRALLHHSLTDGLPDPRDAVVGFSLLRVDAREHGIDDEPIFREVAALSNPEDPHSFIGPLRSYMVGEDEA